MKNKLKNKSGEVVVGAIVVWAFVSLLVGRTAFTTGLPVPGSGGGDGTHIEAIQACDQKPCNTF